MAAGSIERRGHFRGKARPGRVMTVRVREAANAAWVSAETRNIGVGGAFVAGLPPLSVGTQLVLELRLPTTDQTYEIPCVVRWASASVGGMGVQFVGVDVDVMLELNDYFTSLTS